MTTMIAQKIAKMLCSACYTENWCNNDTWPNGKICGEGGRYDSTEIFYNQIV